tara:strand:- start:479 stop:676 length:198 start_codon:yes stop_codon:yes gene_type:complete
MFDNNNSSVASSNQAEIIGIAASDLPLACPSQPNQAWNLHPRVFLDFHGEKKTQCPYCGTRYQII